MNRTAKLCYVDETWAYFTTQSLESQWGDDWNDAPYEHNAGLPYEASPRDKKQWEIIKLAYDGPLETPCYGIPNSSMSVEDINNGACAWLVSSRYLDPPKRVIIPAGTDISKFIALIKEAGGEVYLPSNEV
jgi:hypothetical protein